ncbi:MAG: hypothetical protein VW625_03040, partial [Perlucidibaca sp.]
MASHRPLAWALLVSGALHAVWLVDIDWSWPFSQEPKDEVLEKKKPEKLKRVRLALSGPSADPVIPMVSLLGNLGDGLGRGHESVAAAPPADKPGRSTRPHQRPISTTTASEASEAVPLHTAPVTVKEEPPPSFPVSITAIHR